MYFSALKRAAAVAQIGSLFGVSAAFAQAIVDPGAVERESQRQRQRIEQQQQPPKLQGPAVVGPQPAPGVIFPGGGPSLKLKRVVVGDSYFLTRPELDAITSKYIGTSVDLAALQRMVQEINALYAAKGVVTGNATLPPQKLADGTVTVKLIEGKVGKVTSEGSVQTSFAYIRAHFLLEPGKIADVPKLSNDVAWFNRTSDVQVRALLQPGADFGLTDIKFAVIEPPQNTLQLFTDNQGVQSTGRYQGGVFYKRHSLLGIDDRLTIYALKSEGNLSGNFGYNVPFFLTDGRVGVSYSQGKIRIVDGPLKDLDQKGESKTTSLNFVQPLFVTDKWTVLGNLGWSYGLSSSTLSDHQITDNLTTKEGGGFTLTYATQDYSFSVSPNLAEAHAYNRILETDRKFTLFTGTTTNLVRLPESFSISFIGAWQATAAQLLPGDQLFNIGGPTTVRGYPTNGVAGDSGYYGNLELHRMWTVAHLDTFLFTDFGEVFSTFPGAKKGWSAGAGLSWTPATWITMELSAGFPLIDMVANQSKYALYYRLSLRPL